MKKIRVINPKIPLRQRRMPQKLRLRSVDGAGALAPRSRRTARETRRGTRDQGQFASGSGCGGSVFAARFVEPKYIRSYGELRRRHTGTGSGRRAIESGFSAKKLPWPPPPTPREGGTQAGP